MNKITSFLRSLFLILFLLIINVQLSAADKTTRKIQHLKDQKSAPNRDQLSILKLINKAKDDGSYQKTALNLFCQLLTTDDNVSDKLTGLNCYGHSPIRYLAAICWKYQNKIDPMFLRVAVDCVYNNFLYRKNRAYKKKK